VGVVMGVVFGAVVCSVVCSKGRRGERAWQRVANGGEYRDAAMLLHTTAILRTYGVSHHSH
jgi:hypothetical protein